MKIWFLPCLIFLTCCTQKYADYDLIRKVDFNKESYERPITLMQVIPEGRDELRKCFHQWLFFSNAQKEKEQHIPDLVRSLCPRQEFLINAHFVERWWTTILYSQACVNIETLCGKMKRIPK